MLAKARFFVTPTDFRRKAGQAGPAHLLPVRPERRLARAVPEPLLPLTSDPSGVATGLVSIPNRYMHSPVEMISLDDIDRAADLLAPFAEGLTADVDFTP
jgi:hypothetical protein